MGVAVSGLDRGLCGETQFSPVPTCFERKLIERSAMFMRVFGAQEHKFSQSHLFFALFLTKIASAIASERLAFAPAIAPVAGPKIRRKPPDLPSAFGLGNPCVLRCR